MQDRDVKPGLWVKTTKLGKTVGMTIAEKHLSVRKEGVEGTVLNYVPGHGGDVWYVQHRDTSDVGAYMFTEFEPV